MACPVECREWACSRSFRTGSCENVGGHGAHAPGPLFVRDRAPGRSPAASQPSNPSDPWLFSKKSKSMLIAVARMTARMLLVVPGLRAQIDAIAVRIRQQLAQDAAPALRDGAALAASGVVDREGPDAPARGPDAGKLEPRSVVEIVSLVDDSEAALDSPEAMSATRLDLERRKEPEETPPQLQERGAVPRDDIDLEAPVRAQEAALQKVEEAARTLRNHREVAPVRVHHGVAVARLPVDQDLGPLLALLDVELRVSEEFAEGFVHVGRKHVRCDPLRQARKLAKAWPGRQ